jgi:DNA repair protein RadC
VQRRSHDQRLAESPPDWKTILGGASATPTARLHFPRVNRRRVVYKLAMPQPSRIQDQPAGFTNAAFRRIKDQPAAERPRERLASHGAEVLTPAELIAILLRTGLRGANAVDIGRQLLAQYGHSLHALAQASVDDLCKVKGIGRDKAVTLAAAFALGKKLAEEKRAESPVLDNPEAVAQLVREDIRGRNVETFLVLLLNTRRRLIRVEEISQGTLDTILVHPREVFRAAIAANAACLALAHNHPSGDPTPSEGDIKVTRDLIRAGQLLKIEVLDHVIIGRATPERAKDYASLRELGYFYA